MERREEENRKRQMALEWYTLNCNYTPTTTTTVSPSPMTSVTGNSFPMPENHLLHGGFSLLSENQLRRPANSHHHSFQKELINNPHLSNLDHHIPNSNPNPNANLSLETLYDPLLLEPEFSRLNLSQNPILPHHQQSQLLDPSALEILRNDSLIDAQMFSRRHRVQQAVANAQAGYDHQYSHNHLCNGRIRDPISRITPDRYSLEILLQSIDWSTMDCPSPTYNSPFLYNNQNRNINISTPVHHQSRLRPNFRASLQDLRGQFYLPIKDEKWSGYLQKKFEEGKPEEIELIFSEVKDRICELMVDPSGNYLVQKFFKVCNERQMSQILIYVISDVAKLEDICLNTHGTRAMQKLLEHLTTAEQRGLVVSALVRITVPLTKSMHGHHVIQHCLEFFPSEQIQQILNVVAENCFEIATDKSGCCVLQHCVEHADGITKERLLGEISANALELSEHAFGNYVVQFILGMGIKEVTANILAQLSGSYVSLSMNKYGSNVVEKCLRESSEDNSSQIIGELVQDPNFVSVLQHPFGNYVAQSALALSKGTLRDTMINSIQKHYPFLHSHPHGKRVLAQARGSKQRL